MSSKKEKVVLIADHKHAGQAFVSGDSIEVDEHERAFLIRHKKIAGTVKPASAPQE